MTDDWIPTYSRWRHGGWYVDNVRYPSGAVGCVSRNYPDRKWRIVCANQDWITYANRDSAAKAERELTIRLDEETCPEPILPSDGSGIQWPDGSFAWRCEKSRGHIGEHGKQITASNMIVARGIDGSVLGGRS